jgi:hypothetical protein
VKVFLSWSGDSSKAVASALYEWLPAIFPDVAFWMSTRDIQAGQRWKAELDQQLESLDCGIICVVPGNTVAPWLLFEAGALSKSVTTARVVPYCLGIPPAEMGGPLSSFQGVPADKIGTRKLLESINVVLANKRAEQALTKVFEKWWPDLKEKLDDIPMPRDSGDSWVESRVTVVREVETLPAVIFTDIEGCVTPGDRSQGTGLGATGHARESAVHHRERGGALLPNQQGNRPIDQRRTGRSYSRGPAQAEISPSQERVRAQVVYGDDQQSTW